MVFCGTKTAILIIVLSSLSGFGIGAARTGVTSVSCEADASDGADDGVVGSTVVLGVGVAIASVVDLIVVSSITTGGVSTLWLVEALGVFVLTCFSEPG